MAQHPNLTRRSIIVACVLATLSGRSAEAGDELVILVNARNPTSQMSVAEAQNYFLGRTAFWHGVVPVKLIVRPASIPAGQQFYEKIAQMSAQAFAQHWSKQQLSGKGVAPATVSGASEVAAEVAKTPGSLSFVLASEAWQLSGVKIIPLR